LNLAAMRRVANVDGRGERPASAVRPVPCLSAPIGHVLPYRRFGAFGSRGYRAAQLEAGIVTGRIYLGAHAYRFGATGLTFYDDAITEFFSPDAARKSCMLVVALGESERFRSGRSGT
jgi:hypothetical protein